MTGPLDGRTAVVGCQLSSKRHRAAVLLAVVVCVLAACSSAEKAPATAKVTAPTTTSSSSTTVAPTTTTTTPKPASQPRLLYARRFTPAQEAVAKGYFAAVRAHLLASEHPTLDPSALATNYVGAMLQVARSDVVSLARAQQAVRLPPTTRSLVRLHGVRVLGQIAVADLCSVDDAIVYEIRSGRVVDSDVISQERRATLKFVGGRWKLMLRTSGAQQRGAKACEG